MAYINENNYHIHQYHLNINFMTLPRRQQLTRQRETSSEIGTESERVTVDNNLQCDSEMEDGFHEINLESETENYSNYTSIANENYNLRNRTGAMPKRFLPKMIQPLDEIHTCQSMKTISRKRMKQWSEGDIYLPDMRQNRALIDVHEPPRTKFNTDNGDEKEEGGRRDTIYTFMEQITAELDSHGRQIKNITESIRQSHKVENVTIIYLKYTIV